MQGFHGGAGGVLTDWDSRIWSTIGELPAMVFVTAAWEFNDVLSARLEAHLEVVGARSHAFDSPLVGLGFLVGKGADVEARDGYGDTALMSATREERRGAVEVLLAKGADVNCPGDGETPLVVAAEPG